MRDGEAPDARFTDVGDLIVQLTVKFTKFEPRQMTGKCANGAERDRGKLYHAVQATGGPFAKSVCGSVPGHRYGSGWSATIGEAVTCVRCIAKLEKAFK